MTALNFDPAQTKAFLEALSDEWETEHFAWQPVDDDKTRKIISKVENNTLENIAGFLETKNRGGHAIFVTINKTDGFGRLAKNIVTIRAIWCDWDRVDQPVPAWPIPPHLEVNTSPGKYQFIWCCEILSSETFKQAMARMIELGSDPGAKDVSRVLRVPGFFHQKIANGEAAAPYLVRITRKNDIPRYTNAEIAAAFPANGKTKTKPNGHGDSTLTPAEEAMVRGALTWISAECHRNVWRNIGMALHTVGARSIWDDWSKTCPEAFDQADQDAAWNSFKDDREDGITLGTIYHFARESGWTPRDELPVAVGVRGGDEDPESEGPPVEGQSSEIRTTRFSEDHIALVFIHRHGDEFRYVADRGKWLAWTGGYWEVESTLAVFDLARTVCREAALQCDKPSTAKAIAQSKTVSGVERLAKSDRAVAATLDQWDADDFLFNRPSQATNLEGDSKNG